MGGAWAELMCEVVGLIPSIVKHDGDDAGGGDGDRGNWEENRVYDVCCVFCSFFCKYETFLKHKVSSLFLKACVWKGEGIKRASICKYLQSNIPFLC
jgi:hypothetical protein